VSEPHEPSYYEIALTNRQVVIAFVILLGCLLAAFFSGVWIGRGAGDRADREQVAHATSPAPPAAEGRSLEELKFFTDQGKKRGRQQSQVGLNPPPAQPAPTAAPPAAPTSTAPSPPPASHAPAARPAAPPVPETQHPSPAAPSASRPSASDRAPAGDAGADTVRPRPLPESVGSVSAGRGNPPAAAPTQPGGGSVVVQVFASADEAEAQKVRNRLTAGGLQAFLSPLTVDGRTMYRVRIGPFASRPVAQKEAERVRKTYKLDTWLTE